MRRRPIELRKRVTTFVVTTTAFALTAAPSVAQQPDTPALAVPTMSVTWESVPIRDVLTAFALFSGKSIVAGSGVSGTVTATINDKPWDVALQAILSTRGLVAVENEAGIIRVDDMANLDAREGIEPLLTRVYPLSFVPAVEVQATLAPMLTARGSISVSTSRNAVVVTDVARVHRAIAGVIR